MHRTGPVERQGLPLARPVTLGKPVRCALSVACRLADASPGGKARGSNLGFVAHELQHRWLLPFAS